MKNELSSGERLRPELISTKLARAGAVWLAIGLTALVLLAIGLGPRDGDYRWTLLPWAAAVGLVVFAAPGAAEAERRRFDWRLAGAVGAITLAGLLLRLWHLNLIPQVFGGDEGSFGLATLATLSGRTRNPFDAGWMSQPTMSFFYNGWGVALLGRTVLGARLPWAVLGALSLVPTFLLAQRLQGRTVALLTTALLATYHFHIHFSRLAINNIADGLWMALALWLLLRGHERRSPREWALAGASAGVAQYFYTGARLVPVVVGAVVLWLLLAERGRLWRDQRWGLAALALAALIAAAPMIQVALRFPKEYNARVNSVSVFTDGWLEREQAARGEGTAAIMLDQLKHAALAFNLYTDRTSWYGSPEPLLDAWAGALFLLGLCYATLRFFDRRLVPMVAWWWAGTVLGGALMLAPPSSMRLVTLATPTIFLVALMLAKLAHLAALPLGRRIGPPARAALLTLAVAGLSLSSVHWYFMRFTPLERYGDLNGMVMTTLAGYASVDLGPEWQVYFFGPPRIYVGYATLPFLAPETPAVDVKEPISAVDQLALDRSRHAAFVALPERAAELNFVMDAYPGGELLSFSSPNTGKELFLMYRVPRELLGGGQ